MWCNYQKTWSNSWCCSVDKRLTSGWKQPVHLIIENTAVVSYSRLWQNEVMFHTHSVYNPFLDSGMRWLTLARLEQFVWHWHSVITYSDNNKKACLIINSNLEMVVQIQRKFTSHVLKKDVRCAGIGQRSSFSGWKAFDTVVRFDASWLKLCCRIGALFEVTACCQLNEVWSRPIEPLQSQQKWFQHHHCSWIMQKTWFINLTWQWSLMQV